MTSSEHRTVQGSERAGMEGARVVGPVADDETVDVTVRLRAASGGLGPLDETAAPLTRAELAARHGAGPDDVRAVEAFAHAHGLTVLDASPAERAVRLRGSARAMQDAFGVVLERVEHPGGRFRQRRGPVRIPAHLAEVVTGVFGLDDRPQARPAVRFPAPAPVPDDAPDGGPSAPPSGIRPITPASFTPAQIGTVYGFPRGLDGEGQAIALIELAGGYQAADLDAYAARLGLPPFQVVPVSVDGAQNAPTGVFTEDAEVVLDIEVAAGVAPRAQIVVYFAPNNDRGIIDAVSAAVHDQRRAPGVISISWTWPEQGWTQQGRAALDEVMQEAAAIGVPVFAAAGDFGSAGGKGLTGDHVDFPASSPHVIACGGTRLTAPDGVRTAETVWNDLADGLGASGGGYSVCFPAPAFQAPWIGGPGGRGMPDVAANADPETGYQVRVDGYDSQLGGTSAVAPLLAGLTALCNQQAGHGPGVLLPKLYAAGSPSAAYFDVVEGDNVGYSAAPGWDPCTGLGVPVGTAFAALGWGTQPASASTSASTSTPTSASASDPVGTGTGTGAAVPA